MVIVGISKPLSDTSCFTVLGPELWALKYSQGVVKLSLFPYDMASLMHMELIA